MAMRKYVRPMPRPALAIMGFLPYLSDIEPQMGAMMPKAREFMEKTSPDQREVLLLSPSCIKKMGKKGVMMLKAIEATKTPSDMRYRFLCHWGIYGSLNFYSPLDFPSMIKYNIYRETVK
jgi:hypothetical protein